LREAKNLKNDFISFLLFGLDNYHNSSIVPMGGFVTDSDAKPTLLLPLS
jgi:hypothetical protein